jgi:hypothetical protein
MRLISIIVIGLCCLPEVFAQNKSDRKYIYGTLSGDMDSHTGYFWFDHELSQMGQRILFKPDLDVKKPATLYAMNYETFKSDSVFLRTFKTILYGTGRLKAMLPRVYTGKLELYNAIYTGFYSINESDHFYLYDGKTTISLKRAKFKKQMKEILSDDAEINQRIDRDELKYDDIPEIISAYNLRHPK